MKKKYTRESAIARLKRNGVEILSIKKVKPMTILDPFPKPYTVHFINTRGTGIKLQGTADYLINNFYDMARQ